MQYFKKENPANPVYYPGSQQQIAFQNLAIGVGVIAVDEAQDLKTSSALSDLASKRVGGVVKISQEIYESLKKNAASARSPRPSGQNLLQQIRVHPAQDQQRLNPVAPSAGAVKAADINSKGVRIMPSDERPASSIAEFRQRTRFVKPQPQTDPLLK